MAVSSNDIANQALVLTGDDGPQVTGQSPTWDQSAAGKTLQKLYAPCVATVQRQFGWDAARNIFTLVTTGNSPPMGWGYEYTYPGNGIELWQLIPTPPFADVNNPLPINWDVGNTLVSSVQTKVIWTNLQNALAIYNNNPTEATWDPLFREEVVRLLASELAVALMGKPETAAGLMETVSTFGSLAEKRPD